MATTDARSPRDNRESQLRCLLGAQTAFRLLRMASQILTTFAVLSCWSLAQAGSPQDKSEPVRLTRGGRKWVEATLRGLSLEEKVGQMLQVRCYAEYPNFETADYKWLQERFQKDHVGSVVLAAHINAQGLVRVDPLAAAKTINQLQSDAKLPLLVAADLERGVASRLQNVPDFPWPMALGAVDDPAAAERLGAVTARAARAVGINWALAPVADVNSNPANPIINDRSFGEDPAQVGALVAAFILGARAHGLLATAKHFPGYGDAAIDSHRAIASVDATMDHLQAVEFPPFRKAIEAGVDAILLVHARVPALEPDPEKITTNSAKIVTDVLKGQLAFQGVVLSDALEMRGVTGLYDPRQGDPAAQAAVDAVKAGCDVIMTPMDVDAPFQAIVQAVRSGEIPETRVDESVRKVLRMKAAVGLDRTRTVDLEEVAALTGKPEDKEFAQQIADEAVTLVRHNGQMLPLPKTGTPAEKDPTPGPDSPAKPEWVAIVLGQGLEGANGREFEKAWRSRRPHAPVFYFDNRSPQTAAADILSAIDKAQGVVVAAYVAHNQARQVMSNGKTSTSFGLLGPSGQLLQRVLEAATDKTVVVALGSPYLIESFPNIQTYICAYAMASTSEISAVKALFGEVQNHARLPVTLPGVAERGFALPWPRKPNG